MVLEQQSGSRQIYAAGSTVLWGGKESVARGL
jgi:hypothetical protein